MKKNVLTKNGRSRNPRNLQHITTNPVIMSKAGFILIIESPYVLDIVGIKDFIRIRIAMINLNAIQLNSRGIRIIKNLVSKK